jgi:hypothetical protein
MLVAAQSIGHTTVVKGHVIINQNYQFASAPFINSAYRWPSGVYIYILALFSSSLGLIPVINNQTKNIKYLSVL